MHENASAEINDFLRIDLPSAMPAIATARIVCDLDAGIKISPDSFDFVVLRFNS